MSALLAACLARPRPLALRIDVQLPPDELERELDALQARMRRPGDPLHGLAGQSFGPPDLLLRQREADGELYVYVEDIARDRLAGYTVFNRLIELDRRADRHLRAPHSRFRAAYQRRGLAGAIYRRVLEAGRHCLLSGARQSEGAHALWQTLARQYESAYVDLRDKRLAYLGREIGAAPCEALQTRRLLLGRGWSLEALGRRAGLRLGP
ncbi:N-acetyltransferase [Roseateles sp. DAIF2]|uniref:N-acetyltransferase n=1 Tax=Roseateles sp. DAIF2 TaxID=2714952 RepID=UPI0018A28CD5|nr:N-acetyltransferase [Roseateles sp. DAIF2]QPF73262.1 N-acetyltransferase [Roseateles sp. DAIF2]